MPKTFLILGGYGNAGRAIADLLLKESNCNIIIAGRKLSLAREAAAYLNEAHSGERVESRRVDASSAESLEESFRGIDMVVVASSTSAFTNHVVDAALKANIDYFDIQVCDSARTKVMESFKDRIATSDRCFVTEGGYHPGIPAALVRYAATQFHNIQTANIYIVMNPNWKDLEFSEATRDEFLRELGDMKNQVYLDGKWEKQSWSTYREYDFGDPFNSKYCVPMFLEELRDLPNTIPSLEQVGTYISGFDPVTTYFSLPVAMMGAAVCPRLATKSMARFFAWSLKKFSSPPFGAMIVIEAQGSPMEQSNTNKEVNLRVCISHSDPYFLTAVPAVACLLQLMEGSGKPGKLQYQAHVVDPERFLGDLERLGLHVTIEKAF